MQSDPIGLKGGIDGYVYVSNDPISKSDSFGLIGPDISPTVECGDADWEVCYGRCGGKARQPVATYPNLRKYECTDRAPAAI